MSNHYDRYNGMEELLGTNLAEVGTDIISRAAAQTELQLSARRYTVAHEAHGEGQVVWSESLISVSDAMNVLRKLPSAWPEIIRCKDCQHRDEHGCCKHWKALSLSVIPIATDDDDFCSYAERKM